MDASPGRVPARVQPRARVPALARRRREPQRGLDPARPPLSRAQALGGAALLRPLGSAGAAPRARPPRRALRGLGARRARLGGDGAAALLARLLSSRRLGRGQRAAARAGERVGRGVPLAHAASTTATSCVSRSATSARPRTTCGLPGTCSGARLRRSEVEPQGAEDAPAVRGCERIGRARRGRSSCCERRLRAGDLGGVAAAAARSTAETSRARRAVDLRRAVGEARRADAADPGVDDAVVASRCRRRSGGCADDRRRRARRAFRGRSKSARLDAAAHERALGIAASGRPLRPPLARRSSVLVAFRPRSASARRSRARPSSRRRAGDGHRRGSTRTDVDRGPDRRLRAGCRPDDDGTATSRERCTASADSTGHARTIRACASSPSGSRRGSSPRSSESAAVSSPSRCSSSSRASPSAPRQRRRSSRSRSRQRRASSSSGCGARSRSGTRRSSAFRRRRVRSPARRGSSASARARSTYGFAVLLTATRRLAARLVSATTIVLAIVLGARRRRASRACSASAAASSSSRRSSPSGWGSSRRRGRRCSRSSRRCSRVPGASAGTGTFACGRPSSSALASIIGVEVGARIATELPEDTLRRLFAVLLFAVAAQLVVEDAPASVALP